MFGSGANNAPAKNHTNSEQRLMRQNLLISSLVSVFLSVEAHATVANVPEPSVWALLAGGVAAAVIIRRMKGGD